MMKMYLSAGGNSNLIEKTFCERLHVSCRKGFENCTHISILFNFFPNFQFRNNTLPDNSVDFSLPFKLLQFAPIIWFLRAWNIGCRWVCSTWFVLIVWYFQGGLNMRTEETRNTRTIYFCFSFDFFSSLIISEADVGLLQRPRWSALW